VILLDSAWPSSSVGNVLLGDSCPSPAAACSSFTRYLNSLLDCMMPEQCGIYSGHLGKSREILFFGPDENTANFMDLGAEIAKGRGYRYWKALTTGKSVKLGGIPHDTYGMTTTSVHTYVLELLKELGEQEENITKVQTGGPDGDLGSNEILMSKDKTIAVVDGSGVLYDPQGLNRDELCRLARRRIPVKHFSRSFLGEQGFMVTVEEADVCLSDGSVWRTGAELRDKFHLTPYATADLFVPCGGRPNSVSSENVKQLFTPEGKPKFRMVVEGANLFFSDGARASLEDAGVHVFRDASTNKGGVTSSSLEVFSALALSIEEHTDLMTYDPSCGAEPSDFYRQYVQQVLRLITDNAKQEFHAIWKSNCQSGLSKVEATQKISLHINQMQDNIQQHISSISTTERETLVRRVLQLAVPPLIVQHIGIDGITKRVPENYIHAIVGAWIASRYVYRHGVCGSEVAFFLFMRELLDEQVSGGASPASGSRKRPHPDHDQQHTTAHRQCTRDSTEFDL